MKTISRLCCLLALWSCNGSKSNTGAGSAPVKQDSAAITATPKDTTRFAFVSNLRKGDTLIKGKTYVDTLSFINYDAEGDDGLFVCVKNRDTVSLIFNTTNHPTLNNGDQVLLQWNMDIYDPIGDPENTYPKEFVVDYRLLRPGKVTQLKNKKPALQGIYVNKELTGTGKDEIDAAVWYYVANTTDTAIRHLIDVEQKTLQYTVEDEGDKPRIPGVTPITFKDEAQQVLKRVFFDIEKPYSLSE